MEDVNGVTKFHGVDAALGHVHLLICAHSPSRAVLGVAAGAPSVAALNARRFCLLTLKDSPAELLEQRLGKHSVSIFAGLSRNGPKIVSRPSKPIELIEP